MEFSIQRIVIEMQNFQKEMHNEFKDGKTFWKHFYKKLDKEIYKELKKIVNENENDDFGIVVEGYEKESKNKKQENPQKEVLDFIETIAQKIGVDEIEVIEINKK